MIGTGARFFSKNIVMLVMLPTVVALHYGWYKLQMVDNLVPPEDRDKLPGPIKRVNLFSYL